MLFFIFLLCVTIKSAIGANILFITLLGSPSHHIWHEVFVQGLLLKGHNITLLGYYDAKVQSANYTVLKIEGIEGVYAKYDINPLIHNTMTALEDISALWKSIVTVCRHDMDSEALQVLLEYPKDFFDLIVFDIGMGQCFYPLIEYFQNPPVVAVSPFGVAPYTMDAVQSHFDCYYPIYVLPYSDNMTFLQRVENMLLYAAEYYFKWYVGMPKMYKMAKERFGKNITTFDQMERRIDILLLNQDPVFEYPLPTPQHVILVGGLHIKPVTPLPNDIQKILDDAEEGAIYFSFGTNLPSSSLTKEMKQVFLDTFSKLKYTVLWKYEKEDLQNVPENVIIRKWYQQNNILAHKNVKLFISHNGELSTQEAMYHGVPVIGMPFCVDQWRNAGKVEAKKVGKTLLTSTITTDSLHETIIEVINNPIYKKNMQDISKRFRDRLNSPLETAVFWLEYVLKHKDVSHLSNRGRDMTWYERQNLDIIVFLTTCVALVAYLVFLGIKSTVKVFWRKKPNKHKQI